MLQISIIAFIGMPILFIGLILVNYIISKKYKKIYAVMIALFLAIVAYYMNPPTDFDLYRHHLMLKEISYMSGDTFWQFAIEEKELARVIIMLIISKIGNFNLLQFSIVFLGYLILLLMITDAFEKIKGNRLSLVFVFLYILFVGLNYVDFASGLWFYFAAIVFSLGIYLEYILNWNKKICYLIYLITPFIHITFFLPIILKIIYTYIFKEKVTINRLLILAVIFFIPQVFINIISNYSNISIFQSFIALYKAYFINGNQYNSLHGGINLVIAIIRIVILYYILVSTPIEDKNLIKMKGFSKIILIVATVLMINAGVFMRFITLAEIIAIPILIKYFNNLKLKNINSIISFFILVFTIIMMYLRLKKVLDIDYDGLFNNHILNNIWLLMKSR